MNSIKLLFSKYQLWLLAIILIGLFFRTYQISQNPPSLNWDEVSHGYNAYAIDKTGNDEWGFRLPLIFRAYGDYKLPLYIYLTVPWVALLGLNPLSVRLVSIISGVGLIWLTYLITNLVTKNRSISLFASLLTALSPWGLFVSRVAVEANLAALFVGGAVYFLLSYFQGHKNSQLVGSVLFLGLAMFAYNSARVVSPIFILFILAYLISQRKFKQTALVLVTVIVFTFPLLVQIFNNSAQARFNWVSLIDSGAVNRIEANRLNTKLPGLAAKLVYNRPVYFLSQSGLNYLKNLNPNYLFLRGGSQYQFSLPDHELLYLVTAPFFLIGILISIGSKKLNHRLILFWFLIAIIPSAITRDAPHVLRSLPVLPAPMIFTALGYGWVAGKIKSRSAFRGNLILGVLVFAVLVSFIRWWRDYQLIYPLAYSWSWQYGYQQVTDYVKENYPSYDRIYITKRYGEPHEFVLFYWPWDPGLYQNDPDRKWDFHADWYWVNGFDKFMFINDWEVVPSIEYGVLSIKNGEKVLLVTSPGNYPDGWQKIITVNFLDGQPAFEIVNNDY